MDNKERKKRMIDVAKIFKKRIRKGEISSFLDDLLFGPVLLERK